MDGVSAVLWLLGEVLQPQLPGRHHTDRFLAGMPDPEATGAHVRLDVHRVEPLALGEPDNGLEAPEQGFRGARVQTSFIPHARSPIPCSPAQSSWSGTRLVHPGSSGTGPSRCNR